MQSLKLYDFQKHVSDMKTESLWKTVLLSKLKKVHADCDKKNIQLTNKSGAVITHNKNPKIRVALEDIRRCLEQIEGTKASASGFLKRKTDTKPTVTKPKQMQKKSPSSAPIKATQKQNTAKPTVTKPEQVQKKGFSSAPIKATQKQNTAKPTVTKPEQVQKDSLLSISDSIKAIQKQITQLQFDQKTQNKQCLLDKKSFNDWTTKQLEPALQTMHADIKTVGLLREDNLKPEASLSRIGKVVDDTNSMSREMLVARAEDTRSQLEAIQTNGKRSLQQEIKKRRRKVNTILREQEMASEKELLRLGEQLCSVSDFSNLDVNPSPVKTQSSQAIMERLAKIKQMISKKKR